MWLRRAVLVLVWCVVLWGADARAQKLSGYEQETLKIALERKDATLDPEPEGKVVEGIDVVSLDVIEPRDPAPRFLNWFHATTRDDVIQRESLLRPGDRYTRALAQETERNLRVRQLSVVLVVATKGSSDDKVRLLLVTKDVWSLRLNWEPTVVNGSLQALVLQPSEENFLGRHKTVNGTLAFRPATYSVGVGVIDPRVGGSRLQAGATASVVVNCRTGQAEGSNGAFTYGKPLYSTLTRWSWMTAAAWSQGVTRPNGVTGNSICSGDQAIPTSVEVGSETVRVPYQYRSDSLSSEISATRSFGAFRKNDISFGLEARRRNYRPIYDQDYPQDVQDGFERKLPVSDTRLSPFVQLHAFRNRFLRVLNVETLGLQEDYRLGYDVWLRLYPALEAVGSSRNLFGIYSGLAYTIPLGDGLARAYGSSTIELSAPETTDAEIAGGARLVTPKLGVGRLVFDGFAQDRYRNYLNPLTTLGGTNRLRGYRTSAFVGPNIVTANVEFRSLPVEILTVQVGLGIFYDVGDAFYDFDKMRLKHGVGGGLRVLLPQLDRTVFRLEVAVPLNPDERFAETSVLFQFNQAFPMPGLTNPSLGQ